MALILFGNCVWSDTGLNNQHHRPSTIDYEFAFHREMQEIFDSVRGLHTNYLLQGPLNDKVIFLPFDIEE